VLPWSVSLLEIAAFCLFAVQLGRGKIVLPSDRSARLVLVLFLVFVGLALFQVATVSIYRQATCDELLRLLACAALFLVVNGHFRTKARITMLVRTILFMGTFLVVFAIVQKLTWNGRLFWFYPLDERLREGGSIWGPYINRNHFAGYLEMAIPLGLGLMLYAAPDSAVRGEESRAKRAGRFLGSQSFPRYVGILVLVLLMSAALFMTLSRGGVAAFVVSGGSFLALARLRRATRRKALPIALAVAALAAVVLVLSWERIAQRFELVTGGQEVVRLDLLRDASGILDDNPVFGTGLGTFEQAYPRYQTKYPRLIFDHAHNDYVELATDTGAVGVLLAAGIAAFFLVPLFRRWRDKRGRFGTCIGAGGICSCVAIAVHSGTDFNLHIPANALLLTVIAALTRAVLFGRSRREEPGSRTAAAAGAVDALQGATPVRRPVVMAGVALLAGLLLCYLPIRSLVADRLAWGVERTLDDTATETLDVKMVSEQTLPSYRDAVGALERAARLEPLRSAWPRALAELHGKLGVWARTMVRLGAPLPAGMLPAREELAVAVGLAERAVALEPTNAAHRLALGQLYALAAPDDPRAVAQLRAAAQAAPANAALRQAIAMQHLLAGRRQEALEEARALAGLDGELARAAEIAWRATGDAGAVRSIAPATEQGRAAVEVFLKAKGR
jgi:O-antigen ligase